MVSNLIIPSEPSDQRLIKNVYTILYQYTSAALLFSRIAVTAAVASISRFRCFSSSDPGSAILPNQVHCLVLRLTAVLKRNA